MPISDSFWANLINGSSKRLRKIFSNRFGKVNIGPVYLRYLKHVPPGRIRHHRLLGHETWFNSGQEYLHGLKEIFIEEIYKQYLPPHAYVLDCGANIGLSIIYLKKICPTATIVAFEPDKTSFALLERNVQSHRLTDVELRNQAVWKENCSLSFDSGGSMSSKIVPDGDGKGTNKVEAIRLKNYIDKKINFLKIDIEGAEFEVLLDIEEKLSWVENLFIEYHGSFEQNEELNRLFASITKNGFRYYVKEAAEIYRTPFARIQRTALYDVQLNIFCFRNS